MIAACIAFAPVLLTASPAGAAEVTPEQGVTELQESRGLLDQALREYGNGDAEAAYLSARNSYLDHFEYVEIPLRVRDEGLTLALEEEFAELRTLIEEGASVEAVRTQIVVVKTGLNDVERALSSSGLAAPLIAGGYSFFLLFREGLEAILIIAAVLGYLEATRARAFRKPLWAGIGLALVLSMVVFAAVSLFLNVAPVQRELMEAIVSIVAVAVLFYVSFWLLARMDQRRWMEFLKARVWTAAATGSAIAIAGVGFTTVFREGLETALFYQALLSYAKGMELWVGVGAVIAVGALLGIGWAILREQRRLPVKAALTVALAVVMVMSVSFVGNAVRELQEALVVPVTFVESLPRLPIFLADLTGYHPTVQTLAAQLALILLYALGGAWFVISRRRRRPAEQADAALEQPAPVEA